jgi:hypothetical protein
MRVSASYYAPGAHWAICDRCGMRYRPWQMRTEWTGLRVCHGESTQDCFEVRHPQQYVRGRADRQAVANPRPDPTPVFQSEGVALPDESYLPFLGLF